MITSATSKAEKSQIIQRLKMLGDGTLGRNEKELKLVYVTVSKERFSQEYTELNFKLARTYEQRQELPSHITKTRQWGQIWSVLEITLDVHC